MSRRAAAGYGRDLAVGTGAPGITADSSAPGFVTSTEFFEAGGYGDSSRMVQGVAAQTLVAGSGYPPTSPPRVDGS